MSQRTPIRVYLEAGNPFDLSRDDLDDLAGVIRRETPEIDVRVSVRDEQGYGTTFAEILHLYMEAGEVVADTVALAAAVRWMRARWTRDRQEHPQDGPRGRVVIVYGPDGKPWKAVEIDGPDGEPREVPITDDRHRLPWPPDREP